MGQLASPSTSIPQRPPGCATCGTRCRASDASETGAASRTSVRTATSSSRRTRSGDSRSSSFRPRGQTCGSAPRGRPLQVTARDGRGRKQYRYHPGFRAVSRRHEVREAVRVRRSDLEDPRARRGGRAARGPAARTRCSGPVVWLLERTLIRVGTEELARSNKSYGLTTMRQPRARRDGAEAALRVPRQERRRARRVGDRRADRAHRAALPGTAGRGAVQVLRRRGQAAGDRSRARERVPARGDRAGTITAKDFRTWAGTMDAAQILRELGPAATKKEAERNVVEAIDHTAKRLGNTRAVCRKYYIHPALIEAYLEGDVLPPSTRRHVQRASRAASCASTSSRCWSSCAPAGQVSDGSPPLGSTLLLEQPEIAAFRTSCSRLPVVPHSMGSVLTPSMFSAPDTSRCRRVHAPRAGGR